MKVHIKFITLIMCAILIINNIIFCTTVYAAAAAAPSVGVPTPIELWPQNSSDSFLEGLLLFLKNLFGIRPTINYVDNDGVSKTATYSTTNAQVQSSIAGAVSGVFDEDGNLESASYQSLVETNLLIEACLDEYCKAVSKSQYVGVGKYVDGQHISLAAFDEGITNILNRIGSATSSGVNWGLEMINGVPHNKVEISSPLVIPCFDYLNLDYAAFPDLNSLNLDFFYDASDSSRCSPFYQGYSFFAISSDKTLYVLKPLLDCRYPVQNGYHLSFLSYESFFRPANIPLFHYAFRFIVSDSHIYPCLYSSYLASNEYYKTQYTFGSPSLSYYNFLFPDDNYFFNTNKTPSSIYQNLDSPISFYCPLTSEFISDYDLLKKDISVVGYFRSSDFSNSSIMYNSVNISSASNLLPTYDTLYTGGNQATTSDLSDLQKAIYILAQQYGETYEELLQKLNLIIDVNGNLIISGSDGIQYSVNELSKSFDEIYSKVENISGDLSELLSYLKSLNIEGIEGYISALEGTLNDLNERDKEREAVYGDILGKLDELNNRVGSLNLDDLNSISTDISEIKNLIKDGIKVGAIDIDDILNDNDLEGSIFIEKFPFSLPFDLYRLITLFVREPVEPVFKVPIKTEITAFGLNESIDEEITLDLTMFKINGVDIVQVVLQFSITVGFIVMLIKSTTKLFV